jgi:polyisoprenoid-binding protein YceI
VQLRSFIAATITLLGVSGIAAAQTSSKPVRYVVAPQGNEARYLVREQLMGVDFPNDAVGKTSRVEGRITIAPNGTIVRDESRFTIDLASLTSDRDRRDNYLRGRTLQTSQYPSAVFVPTAIRSLKLPLPKSGDLKFELVGDLTIRGVTRSVTWTVTGKSASGSLTGEARTGFKFADFELEKPRVRSVLSVEDDIRLEYTFLLVPGE